MQVAQVVRPIRLLASAGIWCHGRHIDSSSDDKSVFYGNNCINVLFVQYFVDESDKYLSYSTSSAGLGLVSKNIGTLSFGAWLSVSKWHPAPEVRGLVVVARPVFTINSTGLAPPYPPPWLHACVYLPPASGYKTLIMFTMTVNSRHFLIALTKNSFFTTLRRFWQISKT